MNPSANITEIFPSIQGEGPSIGRHHLFVRFQTCDADCAYCDTPGSLTKSAVCRVRPAPGVPAREVPNPVPAAALGDMLHSLVHETAPLDALALTGGEPLLHADFIAHCAQTGVFPALPLYLETDGNLPDMLEQVIDHVDLVAADIKIPSATGEPANLEANERFLAIARKKECFVKVVYAAATSAAEVVAVADLVARVDRRIPLILQPVTPARRVGDAPSAALGLTLHTAARRILPDVRLIPQTHRLLGLP